MSTGRHVYLGVFVFVAIGLACSGALNAAPVNWLSDSDGNWGTAANWSSNPALPGVADDVTINRPSANPIITHSAGTDTINSLVCVESLALTGGTLTIANASQFNGSTTLSATLNGAGNFALVGPFAWSGGTMGGAGTSTLTGTLSLSADATLARTLTNNNIINWTNGNLFLTNGTLNNNLTLNATAQTRSILNNGGTNLFNNAGTFVVNPGAGFSVGVQVPFQHTGAINIQSGTFFINQTVAFSGAADIAPGASFDLYANGAYNAGAAFTNTGSLRFLGGTHTFNTPISFGNRAVTLQAATLTGASVLTVSSIFNANSGTISGAGPLNLNPGAVMKVASADISLARLTQNNALIDWSGGNIFMTDSTLNNNNIIIARSPARGIIDNGGTNALNNPGTINVDPGLGSYTEITVPFTNTGAVNILSGTLAITRTSTHSSGIDVPAATALDFYANSAINPGTVFTGAGPIDFLGGTHTFNIPMNFASHDITISAATLTGPGDLTFNTLLDWLSGTLSGAGLFITTPTCNLGIAGDVSLLRNLSQNGVCDHFNGNVFMTSAAITNNGTYNCYALNNGIIENGGTNAFNNLGVFNSDAGDGFYTEMRATFTNSGTVNVLSGTFVISRGGSASGIFNIPADSSLQFQNSNFNHNAGITYNGAGLIAFAGGVHTFAAPVDFAAHPVALSNATLTGAGSRTFGDEFIWGSSGTISGPGQTLVAPTGHLRLSGGDHILSSAAVISNGAGDWTGGNIYAASGAFTNNGVLTVSVGSRGYIDNGGVNSFVNTGTLVRNGPGAFEIRSPSTNSGTIDVQAGDLNITRPYLQTAGTLRLSGGNVLGGNTLTIQAGTLEGIGFVVANVTNSGLTRPGLSPGTLAIVGNFAQSASSSTQIEIGGTATTQYDRIPVSGTAAVAGSLGVSLVNAFVPAANNAFYFLTGSSVSGAYSSVTLPSLPGRLRWELVYHPASVELRVILPGDTNCDGVMTLADLPGFVQALIDPAGYLSANPACDVDRADMNDDGNADGLDIQLWINTLLTGG